jgi:hypothetical protein
MYMKSRAFVLAVITGTLLAFSAIAQPLAQAPPNRTNSAQKKGAETTPPPTAAEISDARSKGLVWVNTSTKVYHKDGANYGATKRGKFMPENEAVKAGYRAAKEPGSSKKKAAGQTAPQK